MKIGITGGSGVLGQALIKSIKDVEWIRFKGDISNNNSVCIAIKTAKNTKRFGSVQLGPDNKTVIGFSEKVSGAGEISAGIYSMGVEIFDLIEPKKEVSLEYDIMPNLCAEKKINAMLFEGAMIDIGTPDSYKRTADNYTKYSFFNAS